MVWTLITVCCSHITNKAHKGPYYEEGLHVLWFKFGIIVSLS